MKRNLTQIYFDTNMICQRNQNLVCYPYRWKFSLLLRVLILLNLKFLNFEIEYILRPRSAPAKGAPRLRTDPDQERPDKFETPCTLERLPGLLRLKTHSDQLQSACQDRKVRSRVSVCVG